MLIMAALPLFGQKNKAPETKVILHMKDGSAESGYLTSLINQRFKTIEISREPNGNKIKYESSDISLIDMFPAEESVTPFDTVKLEQLTYKTPLGKATTWLKREYMGERIKLYSTIVILDGQAVNFIAGIDDKPLETFLMYTNYKGSGTTMNMSRSSGNTSVGVSADVVGLLSVGEGPGNRNLASKFFADYPEFAQKIKQKEIDIAAITPVELVKLWEADYGTGK